MATQKISKYHIYKHLDIACLQRAVFADAARKIVAAANEAFEDARELKRAEVELLEVLFRQIERLTAADIAHEHLPDLLLDRQAVDYLLNVSHHISSRMYWAERDSTSPARLESVRNSKTT